MWGCVLVDAEMSLTLRSESEGGAMAARLRRCGARVDLTRLSSERSRPPVPVLMELWRVCLCSWSCGVSHAEWRGTRYATCRGDADCGSGLAGASGTIALR